MTIGTKVSIEGGPRTWRVVDNAPNYLKLRRGDKVHELFHWQIRDCGTGKVYDRWSETPTPYGGDRVYFLYPRGTQFVEIGS